MKRIISFFSAAIILLGMHYTLFIILNKYTEVFQIKHISLTGITTCKDSDFDMTLSNVLKTYKYSLVTLDLMDIKNELEQLTLIETTEIFKEYPSTLKIDIVERIPHFLLGTQNASYVIDREGYILPIKTEKKLVPISIEWTYNTESQIKDPMILGIIKVLSNDDQVDSIRINKEKELYFVLKELKSTFSIGNEQLSERHIETAKKIKQSIENNKIKAPKTIDIQKEKQIALGYM